MTTINEQIVTIENFDFDLNSLFNIQASFDQLKLVISALVKGQNNTISRLEKIEKFRFRNRDSTTTDNTDNIREGETIQIDEENDVSKDEKGNNDGDISIQMLLVNFLQDFFL